MEKDLLIEVAERLRPLVEKKDKSISAIARETGLSRSCIVSYLEARCCMGIYALDVLCQYFGVTADYMIYGKE